MKAPPLPDRSCALFLDFDGTLVDLAPQPDAVRVAAQLPLRLALLSVALDGALAIVSGRPAAQIDAFMQPARFCLAGVHGTERRGPDGVLRRLPAPDLNQARDLIEAFCRQHSGLLLETKPGALALHYRQAPALEQACLAVMQQAQQLAPGMDLLCGKKVMELKPEQAGKGHAVRAFLREPPF
ncbi:trehalose-phosphatase, partial [Hydrogenophaga sp.]|uniref:trehalose-phosphatase n=1 Tax=Hydrogenophaga sp. TaxID=1904254 RepID=UPI0035661278